MKRNGFTLVELLAAIAVLAIISVIAAPSIIKTYNSSRIEAIVIQENKLIEAGDILLDDYCKDAINDSYKEKCDIYYQKLDNLSASELSTEKDYIIKFTKSQQYFKQMFEKLLT